MNGGSGSGNRAVFRIYRKRAILRPDEKHAAFLGKVKGAILVNFDFAQLRLYGERAARRRIGELPIPTPVKRQFVDDRLQDISVSEVREGLQQFNEMWDQLFPLEQNRIVRLIVQRIQVSLQGVDITYQPNGIMEVYGQVTGRLLSA